jgi:hypothetical protein
MLTLGPADRFGLEQLTEHRGERYAHLVGQADLVCFLLVRVAHINHEIADGDAITLEVSKHLPDCAPKLNAWIEIYERQDLIACLLCLISISKKRDERNIAVCLAIRSLAGLDATWDQPGVYLLLGPLSEDGSFVTYVGRASAGLRARMAEHAGKRGREWWTRALLLVRDTTHGWHSGQVGWLEGRLFDLLDGASLARMDNTQRPKDESVPAYDRAPLEAVVEPVAAMLRLLGYAPDALAEEAVTSSSARRARTTYTLTVADLLDRGDLSAGDRLFTTRSTLPGEAIINADGTIIMSGVPYATLSGAGVGAGAATFPRCSVFVLSTAMTSWRRRSGSSSRYPCGATPCSSLLPAGSRSWWARSRCDRLL